MSTPLDGLRSALKPAQEAALIELERGKLSELTRAKYEQIGGVSRSQAAYDLSDLVTLGILERVGTGRATRYRLPGAGATSESSAKPPAKAAAKKRSMRTPSGGRPRKWTDERIRAELTDFCSQNEHWPRAAAFRDAGKNDLYLAASRYGGIDYWAAELGFLEKKSWRLPLRAPALAWPRLSVAALTTVATLAVIGLFGLVFDRGLSRLITADSPVAVSGRQAGTPGGAAAESAQPRQSLSRDEHAVGSRAASAAVESRSRPMFAELRLVARFGSSWLAVRRGSPTSETLFEGMLARGKSLHFRGTRLWLRLGAPHNLAARLGSRRLDLPEETSTILVTRQGLRVVRTPTPFTPPPAPPPAVVLDSPVTLASAAPSTSPAPPPTPSEPAPEPAPPPPQPPSPDPKP